MRFTDKVYKGTKVKLNEWRLLMEFMNAMSKRLHVGQLRYGSANVKAKYMSRLDLELKAYKKSGNAEHLYNVANYAFLESVAPENKKYHTNTSIESVTRNVI